MFEIATSWTVEREEEDMGEVWVDDAGEEVVEERYGSGVDIISAE